MANVAYLCLGANDLERACAFYEEVFAPLGVQKTFPTGKGQMFSFGQGPMIMVTKPFDDQAASTGNGSMVAIQVDSKDQVSAIYETALRLGGTCEGPPGPRGAWGDFAYFRDLDGNKIALHFPKG